MRYDNICTRPRNIRPRCGVAHGEGEDLVGTHTKGAIVEASIFGGCRGDGLQEAVKVLVVLASVAVVVSSGARDQGLVDIVHKCADDE